MKQLTRRLCKVEDCLKAKTNQAKSIRQMADEMSIEEAERIVNESIFAAQMINTGD